jgi:hypothetical protein
MTPAPANRWFDNLEAIWATAQKTIDSWSKTPTFLLGEEWGFLKGLPGSEGGKEGVVGGVKQKEVINYGIPQKEGERHLALSFRLFKMAQIGV